MLLLSFLVFSCKEIEEDNKEEKAAGEPFANYIYLEDDFIKTGFKCKEEDCLHIIVKTNKA